MTEKHENLLASYFSNRISDSEREEIASLLASDSEFAACFKEMEEAYAAACIPAFEKTKTKNYKLIEKRIRTRRSGFSTWKYFSVAASLTAVLLLISTLYTQHKYKDAEDFIHQSSVMTVTANNGTGTEAVLPDGTRVHLNAQSSLSFNRRFGRAGRDVTLDGEGYFEVAHDSDRPFRVHAGNACVTVKGTVFNVRNYSDESQIAVSLLEGSVALNTASNETTLKPGFCALVVRGEDGIRVEKADPSASDWIKGKIVFTDKSIPEILRYVERNYGVQFVYAGKLFSDEHYTGNISSNLSIDEILSYIDVDDKYCWNRQEDTIEIFRKQK